MGLITGLLTLPLAPVRGVSWLAELVEAEAERQHDEQAELQARLVEIERARSAGEISAADAVELEERALDGYWASRDGVSEGG